MKAILSLTILLFVLVTLAPLSAQTDRALQIRIDNLQQLIARTHSGWQAGVTSMSRLPLIEFQNRLGLVANDYTNAAAGLKTAPPPDVREELPAYVNWKEQGGITAIKDQGHCGSCYAFASCALIESHYLRTQNITLDLSEQYFMMKTKVANLFGGCKGNNLWICAATCIAFGAPLEEKCPYLAEEQACPDDCGQKYRAFCMISSGVDGFKKALANDGPIVAGFMVYEDFRDYTGGVYRYTTGSFLGGHAILIVGYNDAQQYWIVKNSWGTDWGEPCDGKSGERGYFRIGFNECMIEMPLMGPFYAPAPGK